ncbi:hypothetical protein OG21DRAFT_738776 [Imleria badia]|nr:hypothetical protein OG21DRAFT_738776 [Imleria badia]
MIRRRNAIYESRCTRVHLQKLLRTFPFDLVCKRMHHALQIQEILSHIFIYCNPLILDLSADLHKNALSDLAGLARTCRVFKEPAFDVLWEALNDLSPLVRCLPETSHQVSPGMYSFTRPLTQTEWDVLQGYTRRIRSLWMSVDRIGEESLQILSNPPTTAPLFPNLRTLSCQYTVKTMPLLRLPFPSLAFLLVMFENPQLFQNSFNTLPNFFPNIKRLAIYVQSVATIDKIEPNDMCRWQNLCSVVCPCVALDVDTLAHLSRMPALTHLEFALSATLPLAASNSPIVCSNVHDFKLNSKSLETISRFLSRIQLPAITSFSAVMGSCPSRQELSSFFAGIQTSNAGHAIERLRFHQSPDPFSNVLHLECPNLGLEDLRPCMAFNLRQLSLDIVWNVGLTDSDLLTLASAWPHLENLVINEFSGWNALGGITPDGLLQLLQTCRSLNCIALAIDTRDYTELPPSGSPGSLGLTLPPRSNINVLDSVIEPESVPAVAAFFAGIAPCSDFYFSAWRSHIMLRRRGQNVYKSKDRWDEVYSRASEAVSRRS